MYHGTYKHAGKKKPTRRKYGDAVHLPLNEKIDRIPLTDMSNAHGDHTYAIAPTSKPPTGTLQFAGGARGVTPSHGAKKAGVSVARSSLSTIGGNSAIELGAGSGGSASPAALNATVSNIGASGCSSATVNVTDPKYACPVI